MNLKSIEKAAMHKALRRSHNSVSMTVQVTMKYLIAFNVEYSPMRVGR